MSYKNNVYINRVNSIVDLFDKLYLDGNASFQFPSNPKIEQLGVRRSWEFLIKDESLKVKNAANYYINHGFTSEQFVKQLYSFEATDLKEKIAKMLLMVLSSAEPGFVDVGIFDSFYPFRESEEIKKAKEAKIKEGEKNLTIINNLYNIISIMIDHALFIIKEHSYIIHEADWISFMLETLSQLPIEPNKENLNYQTIRTELYKKLRELESTYLRNHRGIGVDYRNPDPEVPKF